MLRDAEPPCTPPMAATLLLCCNSWMAYGFKCQKCIVTSFTSSFYKEPSSRPSSKSSLFFDLFLSNSNAKSSLLFIDTASFDSVHLVTLLLCLKNYKETELSRQMGLLRKNLFAAAWSLYSLILAVSTVLVELMFCLVLNTQLWFLTTFL